MPDQPNDALILIYETLYGIALDIAGLIEQRLDALIDALAERDRQLSLPFDAELDEATSADIREF